MQTSRTFNGQLSLINAARAKAAECDDVASGLGPKLLPLDAGELDALDDEPLHD